jgi:hypothetical protein
MMQPDGAMEEANKGRCGAVWQNLLCVGLMEKEDGGWKREEGI